MNEPPPYPRIPHLLAAGGTPDDEVLPPEDAAALLARPVLVEEKLDGANVAVWLDATGVPRCALRSGVGGQDRGRQLGPLRAWLFERPDALRELLDKRVLYGEWLFTTHSIAYDALPSYLICVDLWDGAFAAPDDRNRLLAGAGLEPPPEVFRGAVGSIDALGGLVTRSRAGAEPMEGVVVRALDGEMPRLAKLLRAGFRPVGDAEWQHGRPRNRLRGRDRPWR